MSKASSTAMKIPDNRGTHIEQEVQYGVVWPDGTHTWNEIHRGSGMIAISIAALVPGGETSDATKWSPSYWTELLESRAKAAKLDVDEYRDLHHFIKRTVVVAVTAAEVV